MKSSGDTGLVRGGPTTAVSTRDVDQAAKAVTDSFVDIDLYLPTPPNAVDMQLVVLTFGDVTAGLLSYGRELRVSANDLSEFHVNAPLRGNVVSQTDSCPPLENALGNAAVFPPGAPAAQHLSADCVQLCLMVPRSAVERELESLIGAQLRTPLEFDFAMDLSSDGGLAWRGALRLLLAELRHPTGLSANPTLRRHIEALVIDGLLVSQPHNHSEMILRDAAPGGRSAVNHARELIHDRPGEPWTTTTLASAVHLSVRALQEGFKRDVGQPPMAYLREVRMRRANLELARADRRLVTVRDVALANGFLHLGRFAGHYRETFGETPSETLAREPD